MRYLRKVVIVVSAVLFLTGIVIAQNENVESQKKENADETIENVAQEVQIEIEKGKEKLQYTVNYKGEKTAFQVLDFLASEDKSFEFDYEEYDFGILITTINGVTPIDNEFWKFKVNGEDSMVGVSEYQVNSGDYLTFVIDTF